MSHRRRILSGMERADWPMIDGVDVDDCICGDDEHGPLPCTADCRYCEVIPVAYPCPADDLR